MDNLTLTSRQRWLKKSVGDDWDDVVQEATMKCLNQSAQPYYDAYLSRAITNEAINFLKHRSLVEMVSLTDREERYPFLSEYSYEIDFGAIKDLRDFMLPRWSALERDVIFMFFTDQIPIRVVAEMLKKSRMSTQRWLQGVKREFKERLSEYAYA